MAHGLIRTPLVVLFVSLIAAAIQAQPVAAPTTQAAAVQSIATVGMTVGDLDRSVSFFRDVLTFQKVSEVTLSGSEFAASQGLPASAEARVARMSLGDEFIELTAYVSPKGRLFPVDSRSNDRWFQHIAIVVNDMQKAHALLGEKMVRHASKNPQRLPDWNKNAAGIKAFYFRDPDGHYLELLEFPADKGDPKWHRMGEKIFLGIDHTAIVVRDTQASVDFYRDKLGMKVVGASENYGMEQEALNNVPGAHLRITTLRAPSGPAIELLEYLHPRDGRPYPQDARSNDLLHWQTTLIARDFDSVVKLLRENDRQWISDPITPMCTSGWDGGPVAIIRDPDGHAMKIRKRE